VTIRSVTRQRWQDLRDALTTVPDWRTWRRCAIVYALFLVCALPIGMLSGLLHPGVAHLGPAEMIGSGVLLLVHPAFVEEVVFRGLLLPRDGSSWPRGRLFLVAGAALAVYVASHPINALVFRPQVLGLFASTPYLALATLLGLACTGAYLISRSIWPPVAFHWATVVVWLWLLGGQTLIGT
jgi:predicted Abi (CAAX) family protease